MATREEVRKGVVEVVVAQYVGMGKDATTIADDDNLCKMFKLDALDKLELVMCLEEKFDIEITDEECHMQTERAEAPPTINTLTDFILSKLPCG